MLGDLDAAVDGPWGQRHDASVGRTSAAASNGSPASVKQGQAYVVLSAHICEGVLGLHQLPGGGERAGVLSAVAVANHDLLSHASGRELTGVGGVSEQAAEDVGSADEVVAGLEEGDDVQSASGGLGGKVNETGLTCQQCYAKQVFGPTCHGDDVGLGNGWTGFIV